MTKRRVSPPVNNISDLRRHALHTLDMLVSGDIEVEDAHAASELYKDVLGTLRAEVDYNKTLGRCKEIKFYEGEETSVPVLEATQVKMLENKWKGI